MNNNEYLVHHGILGMKWGVRRSQNQLARASRASSEADSARKLAKRYTNAMDKRALKKPDSVTRSSEAARAHKLADSYVNAMDKKAANRAAKAEKTKNAQQNDPAKKSVKDMSDAELRQKINRIQMEQQYGKLTGTDVNRGKQVASKIFKAGTTVAAVTTTGLTIYNNTKKIKEIIEKTT